MFASSSSYARLFARKAAAPAGGVVASASFSLGFCYDRQVARVVVNNHQRKLFSSSSNNNTSSNNSNSFLSWYEANLNRRPVLTKSITGCSLWGIGDAVAQLVPDLAAGWKQQHEQQQQQQNDYDLARTARACFYGFAIHAPLSHLHFNFLEYLTIKGGFKGLQITVFKTVMEQFVYWSWLSNALYHGSMGAMQGKTLQQSWDYIQSVIWETQKAQWVFWIPVQLLNFNYVPVRHQLNVVLLTSIVWTALLSMWYPPINTTPDNTSDEQGGGDKVANGKTK